MKIDNIMAKKKNDKKKKPNNNETLKLITKQQEHWKNLGYELSALES